MTTKTVWLSDVKSSPKSYSIIADFIGDEFLSFEERVHYMKRGVWFAHNRVLV